MRKKRKVSLMCLLILAVLQIGTPSSAQNNTAGPTVNSSTTTTTSSTTTSAPLPYRTRPTDVVVTVGEPAVFRCGVPEASPGLRFTFYGSHGNYSLSCPGDNDVEDIPQALYGSCKRENGESLAVWTLKGTSLPDNSTRVVCQQPNNPYAPSAVLLVYDNGTSYALIVGCTIGGFFGILLVFGLLFLMLRESRTLQNCFRVEEVEEDKTTIVKE
ncbi:uncharacterized protein LOC125015729 [Mugil cephalus]|uniref:uncharacterized protein LOC125015729 n=1 Tax=Mugil cephalus TaxID=48193 RepID=UPI001FB5E919|nr:uncharacterized protein LOC125015729 [Mugil cephalus]